jgi:hypothetical protein
VRKFQPFEFFPGDLAKFLFLCFQSFFIAGNSINLIVTKRRLPDNHESSRNTGLQNSAQGIRDDCDSGDITAASFDTGHSE